MLAAIYFFVAATTLAALYDYVGVPHNIALVADQIFVGVGLIHYYRSLD